MSVEHQACEVPLTERMRSVPRTARMHIENEMHPTLNVVVSSSTYAVGDMLHLAADELDSLRTRLADAEADLDKEQARWQERLDVHIAAVYPDRDGTGCDSGDPLDVTEGELRQAFNHLQDQIDRLTADLDAARKVIERLPKTADGVPITPGMKLNVRCEGDEWPDYWDEDMVIGFARWNKELEVIVERNDVVSTGMCWASREAFTTTRSVAESAKAKEASHG